MRRLGRTRTPGRQGHTIFLGNAKDVLVAGDLHGHLGNFQSVMTTAALAANPKAMEDLKGGKKKPDAVKGFLRGQVMKQTGGKADPALVGELLDARLAELAQ